MKLRRETEPDPDLVEAARDLVGPQVYAHPKGLQGVRAAGQRRGSSVTMLDHRHTRGGDHDGRHSGQVHRVDPVATGADDVDGVVADQVGRHRTRVREHHVGQLTDLARGGNLHLHGDGESGDLGGPRVAAHDLLHGPARLTRLQMLALR
ncbi:hypothetical protein NJB1604_07270 [Mycobacterium marinum]|nr:hypothetical protein NJB1604_07270 [Mycobacterium marinum]